MDKSSEQPHDSCSVALEIVGTHLDRSSTFDEFNLAMKWSGECTIHTIVFLAGEFSTFRSTPKCLRIYHWEKMLAIFTAKNFTRTALFSHRPRFQIY